MKKIQAIAIGVIYNPEKDKFLLTQRKDVDVEHSEFMNCWNFPGGGIEFGESPEKAVVRELKEELGIDTFIHHIIPKVFSTVRSHWHGLLICFVCTMKQYNSSIVLNHEANQYGWFSLDEIQQLPTLPLVYEIAKEASKHF